MNNYRKEIFGRNLSYYMAINGKTKKDLEKELGIPYTSLIDYEKGICFAKMDRIEQIANYFGVSPMVMLEDRNTSKVIETINNNEDNKLLLDIMIKLSKLNLDEKKYIQRTINMISNDKQ